MTRNTEHRVELLVPILDSEIRDRLYKYLETQWKDNVKARVLQNTGDYKKIKSDEEPFISQNYFMNRKPYHFEVIEKKESFFDKIRKIFG